MMENYGLLWSTYLPLFNPAVAIFPHTQGTLSTTRTFLTSRLEHHNIPVSARVYHTPCLLGHSRKEYRETMRDK